MKRDREGHKARGMERLTAAGPTIIPICRQGLSSERVDYLPEVTQPINGGTWLDTCSF